MIARVGILPAMLGSAPGELCRFLAVAGDAGVDHVAVGDHVSFLAGAGRDGLIDATAVAVAHPTLPVHVAVYLLALRHPVLVARQLSTCSELAPGRLVLGVGVGGEDRHEVAVCGVDPASRGRRTNECLAILRRLLAGGDQSARLHPTAHCQSSISRARRRGGAGVRGRWDPHGAPRPAVSNPAGRSSRSSRIGCAPSSNRLPAQGGPS
jgi:alkanesulfonate monooxygenase SsuD/methylene tetrahydromethanopterin reductase-like flavin-dependent oxidoreductase (luciferase family)